MIITTDAGTTLELCFVWQKLQPGNIDVTKETTYRPSRGTFYRLTRDKKGNIVNLPRPRHDVTETKPGRASTTARTATGSMAGRVLAAALNQPSGRAALLQFLYDPECPIDVFRRVEAWARVEMDLLFPESYRNSRRAINASALVWSLLLDFSQRLRSGADRYTEGQLCQHMGFVNKQDAHYDRDYKRVVGDFLLAMQEAESVAIAPVCRLLNQIFKGDEGRPMAVVSIPQPQALSKPKPEPETPKRLVMPFETLSIRRQLTTG